MKLFCLILSLTTITAHPAVDVEKTVLQVQSILQANSQLPRLTRQEILELLNDIKAEDAKSTSTSSERTSTEKLTTTTPYSNEDNEENEINPATSSPYLKNDSETDHNIPNKVATRTTKSTEESTSKPQPTLMVVLPYTPRDGSSLQELYTKPPRTEVVNIPTSTSRPQKTKEEKLMQTLKNNHDLASAFIQDFPADLQAFLDAHGLKGSSEKDHFLLPLDGFKPLPPARVVDGTVQLPENILLTYDLISPESNASGNSGNQALNNYLYEPLRPELPFELETSESEAQKTVIPLDLPKSRKTKSSNSQPLLEPLDYDSIKVIPLGEGPSPVEEVKLIAESEQNKRQANDTATTVETTTSAAKEESPAADSSGSADTDSGASITDLEESFGGAAPEKPGDAEIPPPRRNGFYWMLDWNSFLEVGDEDKKVNIRFEPKLGDPHMFLPVSVP